MAAPEGAPVNPAPRHPSFPIGRVCMICGKGGTPKLGGCAGAKGALLALGYVWDQSTSLGFAHLPCLIRARKARVLADRRS